MNIKNINALAETIHQGNKEKGFYDNPIQNVGERLMLIVSELGEALEAHRKNKFADSFKYLAGSSMIGFDKEHFEKMLKDTFEDEIADTFIRLLDFSASMGIDLEFHVREKLRYNATREHKHGKTY